MVRSLHDARKRRQHGLFVVEGGHSVVAALRARWPLERLLVSPEDVAGWQEVAGPGRIDIQIDIQAVEPDLLEYLSDAQTSPGVLALARLPALTAPDWDTQDLLLVLDGIGDPGNAGTLIRAADAAGAGGVVLAANSVDPFNPKVIRAATGSFFNLPPLHLTANAPADIATALQQRGLPVIAAVAHGGEDCFRYRWPRRCALVLGHETRGLSSALDAAATARVTIPIFGRAESLNVAMAGTVLLYAWRQTVNT